MKKAKRIANLALSALMVGSAALSAAACGGNDANTIRFWVYGGKDEVNAYDKMTDAFNATYGKEHGINVKMSIKPVPGYESTVQTGTMARSCPDVFLVIEDWFKKWIGMKIIVEMDEYFDAAEQQINFDQFYGTTVDRLRYQKSNNTSDPDDPLYGLPLDNKPTALFYNESMFKKAGIVVISVDEEDMAAFNAGGFADKRGKTLEQYKQEYPILNNLTGDIPAKGYFRSLFPYSPETGAWTFPDKSEVLIFNNRIPMNWDEIEDLAMLFTDDEAYNSNAKEDFGSTYGLFTEWWFNYGWSVGGDCLQDLTGDGDWNYSLLDYSANYMVQTTYTGHFTGKTYQAGETLEFMDKFDVPAGAQMQPDATGGYTYNGSQVGVPAQVTAAVESGALAELPSTREAFARYLKLGAEKDAESIEGGSGLDISPNPNTFANRTRVNYFCSQEMAMLVDYSSYMPQIHEAGADKRVGFEWDVAPLPVYKKYEDLYNPYNDDYVVKGKSAGQSNAKAMVSCENSKKKDKAAEFMIWMATEGQRIIAREGFFPNQKSMLQDIVYSAYAPKNVDVFAQNLEYQGPGDWWYMPDYAWINVWAVPLNSHVRNGEMAYSEWKETAITDTNTKLLEYKGLSQS